MTTGVEGAHPAPPPAVFRAGAIIVGSEGGELMTTETRPGGARFLAWVSELVTQNRYVADVWPSN